MKTRTCLLLFLLFLLALPSLNVQAADYPKQNIKVIVPYGAGGGTDTQARLFLAVVDKYLGKPTVIINKPGAGGEIGNTAIARSKPDGYNLGVITYSDSAIRAAYKKTTYANDDFRYVATYTKSPVVLITKKDAPYSDLKGYVEYAKKNPGKITVAVVSDTHNLTQVLLQAKAGIEISPVFYKSGSAALNALLGGHVDSAAIAVQFGKVALGQGFPSIAVAGEERVASLPDSPTFKENGYDIMVTQSRILVAPKTTPDDIIAVLQAACDKAAQDPSLKEKIDTLGEVYQYIAGDELATFVRETNAGIEPIVKKHQSMFIKK